MCALRVVQAGKNMKPRSYRQRQVLLLTISNQCASVPARDDDNEAVDPTFDLESSVRSDRDYQIINTIPLVIA